MASALLFADTLKECIIVGLEAEDLCVRGLLVDRFSLPYAESCIKLVSGCRIHVVTAMAVFIFR